MRRVKLKVGDVVTISDSYPYEKFRSTTGTTCEYHQGVWTVAIDTGGQRHYLFLRREYLVARRPLERILQTLEERTEYYATHP